MSTKTTKKKKSIAKVKSLSDLWDRANGETKTAENYQRLCIVALRNLGCDHLAEAHKGAGDKPLFNDPPKWRAYYDGLIDYVGSLVGEYGISEDKAFRDVRDEVNFVRDCIDQADLEW